MKMSTLAATALLALGTFAVVPLASYAADNSASIKSVDKDSDGTIDMTEAKTAAMNHFATADKDRDGTLDAKEAGMDVSKVDADKDGTVDKSEFGTSLSDAFKAADADHDGTVDAAELASPEGQTLKSMID